MEENNNLENLSWEDDEIDLILSSIIRSVIPTSNKLQDKLYYFLKNTQKEEI